MLRPSTAMLLTVLVVLSFATAPAEESWYRAPSVSIMTGFIKEPLKPHTIDQWAKGLGDQLDADRWVADFKEAGAEYLIFYDKWIDGLVFHDTKTAGFKTRRDFVRDIAAACQRGGLRLVFYFNAVSDGNPEFEQWELRGRDGTPLVFSARWPTHVQTLHSPFRRVSVEQVRELLTGYGPVHGLWLDIFRERTDTDNRWVAQAYEKTYGTPWKEAAPERLSEFNVRTLADYLDEVQPIARQHQPEFAWTFNGSATTIFQSGLWARHLGPRMDYGSVEGHRFERIDRLARMAWVNRRPTEIGILLCSTWFTPMEDAPPPAAMTPRQAIAAAAVAVCQGASVYLALTPGHSGLFGEDLERAKAIGAWFRAAEPVLAGAEPYADVAVILGSPDAEGAGLDAAPLLWKRPQPRQSRATDAAVAVCDHVLRAGVFGRMLSTGIDGGNWPESLSGFRAVLVPERALLDEARVDQLRQYVKQGGRLLVFGHGSMLDGAGKPRGAYALGDVLGVEHGGEVEFPPRHQQTIVKVDSEYSAEFSAENLVDGTASAWASAGTPMPHWAEIHMPEPVDVAKVELISRAGPYRVTDFDVEAYDANGWKLVESIRGAAGRQVAVPLEPPVSTDRVRVTIRRELYQDADRQYADVEAIRILDRSGRDRAVNQPAPVLLVGSSPDWQEPSAGAGGAFPAAAVRVEPTSAEVLARLELEGRPPAVLRNRCGQGQAFLVTAGEASLEDASFRDALVRLVLGKPTMTCSEPDRYRIVLTRPGSGHALHLIDRATHGTKYEAARVTVSVDFERLGRPQSATLVGTAERLPVERQNGRITFVVRPDPVASVVLR